MEGYKKRDLDCPILTLLGGFRIKTNKINDFSL